MFRGLVSHWPIVAAARSSTADLADYLKSLECGATIRAFVGEPQAGGRFFYSDDLAGFNFHIAETKFAQLIATLVQLAGGGTAQPIYMGSTPDLRDAAGLCRGQSPGEPVESMPTHRDLDRQQQPGRAAFRRVRQCRLRRQRPAALHPVPARAGREPLCRAARQDGRRPADQHGRSRRARFRALPQISRSYKHAAAELEPGDAIYIPALWWHAVERRATECAGQLLVEEGPADAGSPIMRLAMGCSRSATCRSANGRLGGRCSTISFSAANATRRAHPRTGAGIIGPSTPELRRVIKQFLMRRCEPVTGAARCAGRVW